MFDTISPEGGFEAPVLTHFAAVFTDITPVRSQPLDVPAAASSGAESAGNFYRELSDHNLMSLDDFDELRKPYDGQNDTDTNDTGESFSGSFGGAKINRTCGISEITKMKGAVVSGVTTSIQQWQSGKRDEKGDDRIIGCKKYNAPCSMSSQSFMRFAATVRLSDLVRFMLSCENPVMLTDSSARYLHVNLAWTNVFGYTVSETEMYRPFEVLTGKETNVDALNASFCEANVGRIIAPVNTLFYGKGGSRIRCEMTNIPILGGLQCATVTHYCAIFHLV